MSKNVEDIASTVVGGVAGINLITISKGLLGVSLATIDGISSIGRWLPNILKSENGGDKK